MALAGLEFAWVSSSTTLGMGQFGILCVGIIWFGLLCVGGILCMGQYGSVQGTRKYLVNW